MATNKNRHRKTQKSRRKYSGPQRYSPRRFKLSLALLTLLSLCVFYLAAATIHHTLRFTALIDLRLQGKAFERPSWVHARDYELRSGQRTDIAEVIDTLNALGYQEGDRVDAVNSFFRQGSDLVVRQGGRTYRVEFEELWLSRISLFGKQTQRLRFQGVPVATLFGKDRIKQRWLSLNEIPPLVSQAVVATEDRRFFEHTGLDPLGILRAAYRDLSRRELKEGASTITQQLVKNYFLTPERTIRRKLLEIYLAIILEKRATKEQILELYLNEVYLGQRGSFGIHGVGQAAQSFFGKDVTNLELSEAALIAAIIRSPNQTSPFRHPEQAKKRRDIVLEQMVSAGFADRAEVDEASNRPIVVKESTVDVGEAPSFVDALRRELMERLPGSGSPGQNLHIRASMDRYLQNAAQRAVVEGLQEVEQTLDKGTPPPQAALVAMNPQTGDILALVGSRSYSQSQFNRALDARRQPGSAFKPFVFLTAFERSHRGLLNPWASPSSIVVDESTTFRSGNRSWTPQNYSRQFEGRVSYRQALAMSLNVATARVGEHVGFEQVVALWESLGTRSQIEPYPSLVLGSFEVTPLELAAAYAVIANGGLRVEPRWFVAIDDQDGNRLVDVPVRKRRVSLPESTYLVTDMMRSVIDAGTGIEARKRGLKADAAGKTGTTNDTRDAWFVGFTPDVLAVVWVGYDDNRPLELTGSQAALPIWVRFMKSAVSGHENRTFRVPENIISRRIDPQSGELATDACPAPQHEVFFAGTEPQNSCPLH